MSQPVIFDGATRAKLQRSGLNLNDTVYVLQGTDDPTSLAKDAPQGSLYLMTGSAGGRIFKKQDAGSTTNWEEVGSGGSSGINYILNPDADAGTTGWATYADAAASTPVDGTGGSPTLTLTRTTSSPLRGSGSFLITKDAANRQGEGVSYAFTIDNADKNKKLSVSFDFEVASGTFVVGDSSDLRVYVYDVTNATLITPSVVTLPGTPGKFQTTWDSTTSTSYRLILHTATTSASAWTLKFDNVIVGPQQIVFGPAMSDWQTYSLTIGATTSAPTKGTIVRDIAQWRRVGDTMEIRYDFEQSAAGSAGTGTYLFPLPSGYSVDTAKCTVSTTNEVIVGKGIMATSADGLTNNFAIDLTAYDSTNLSAARITTSAGNLVTSWTKVASTDATSALSNTTLIYSFTARVPISGWSTNVTAANSAVFQISSFLANGTRVTGSAPTKLGEYRSYLRNAGALTYTEVNGSPTAVPTSSNGIALYTQATTASADTNNQPSRYDIFVGKNKTVSVQFFQTTGRTGFINTDAFADNATGNFFGCDTTYDPTTGLLTVRSPARDAAFSNRPGRDENGGSLSTSPIYFDVTVSENALSVQMESPNSEIHVRDDAGFGSTNTAIRRYNSITTSTGSAITYTSSATLGDSFTFNESGFYAAYVTGDFNASNPIGLSLNSTQLTTSIASITNADRKAMVVSSAANQQLMAHVVLKIQRGGVLRAHASASAVAGANSGTSSVRIIKIS